MMYVDCGYKEMWFKGLWFDAVEGIADLPPGNLLNEVGQTPQIAISLSVTWWHEKERYYYWVPTTGHVPIRYISFTINLEHGFYYPIFQIINRILFGFSK